MTITIEQASRGMMRYIDEELVPHLPAGKGIAIAIAAALMENTMCERASSLRENSTIKTLGIFTEDGMLEIDKLYNAARPRFEGKKVPIEIPVIGTFHFDANDVDKLYRTMQE